MFESLMKSLNRGNDRGCHWSVEPRGDEDANKVYERKKMNNLSDLKVNSQSGYDFKLYWEN